MDFLKRPPTVEEVAAHARRHPLYGVRPKKRGKVEVYEYKPSGSGFQVTVQVADVNCIGLWLVKLPTSPVKLVRLRVIKGVAYEKNIVCVWHELTGDWQLAKYLPVTREGLPLDYQKEAKAA